MTPKKVEAKTPAKPVEEKTVADLLASLDMEEIDFAENLSGMSMEEIEVPGRPKALFIAAAALVVKRRSVADFSWSDARKLKMNDIKEIIQENIDLPKAATVESTPINEG